jgi:hypothetical protein
VFAIEGHAWQREPYVDDSDRISWTYQADPMNLNASPYPGQNAMSQWVGSQ